MKKQEQLQNSKYINQQQIKPSYFSQDRQGIQLSHRLRQTDKIDQNKAKREEISDFLDQSLFMNITQDIIPNKSSVVRRNSSFVNTSAINTNKMFVNQTQFVPSSHLSLNQRQLENKENTNIQNQLIKLFPDRAIKATGFIDIFNTSKVEGQRSNSKTIIRIRNPQKRLVENVDFAVKDMQIKLEERNIPVKMIKIRDLVYEIVQSSQLNLDQPPKSKQLKFGLSGSELVVRQGGGYVNFLEYIDRHGFRE
eukprot:403371000